MRGQGYLFPDDPQANGKDEFSQALVDGGEDLLDLLSYYKSEAIRCREAGAYLAGCVMVGAALEAHLLWALEGYYREIIGFGGDSIRAPRKCSLAELIALAEEWDWVPQGVDPEVALRKVCGDHEVIRRTRNLLHPGLYLQKHKGFVPTRAYLDLLLDYLDKAVEYFHDRLVNDMEELALQMQAMERTLAKMVDAEGQVEQ